MFDDNLLKPYHEYKNIKELSCYRNLFIEREIYTVHTTLCLIWSIPK